MAHSSDKCYFCNNKFYPTDIILSIGINIMPRNENVLIHRICFSFAAGIKEKDLCNFLSNNSDKHSIGPMLIESPCLYNNYLNSSGFLVVSCFEIEKFISFFGKDLYDKVVENLLQYNDMVDLNKIKP